MLEDGKLIESGTHIELLSRQDSKYRAFYNAHTGKGEDENEDEDEDEDGDKEDTEDETENKQDVNVPSGSHQQELGDSNEAEKTTSTLKTPDILLNNDNKEAIEFVEIGDRSDKKSCRDLARYRSDSFASSDGVDDSGYHASETSSDSPCVM